VDFFQEHYRHTKPELRALIRSALTVLADVEENEGPTWLVEFLLLRQVLVREHDDIAAEKEAVLCLSARDQKAVWRMRVRRPDGGLAGDTRTISDEGFWTPDKEFWG
jgi:hypothetical protein